MRYVAEVDGHWVAILTFSGAAPHLKQREKWVGWNARQRARRLGFVINNSRFLLLVERERHPNLALKSLGLALRRVARDWQERWVSMSSKINFQSLEDEGLEFVTRLSNSTLEALLKDLPGETQLELTDAHRLIEIEHNGKRHVIAGGPWRKDRDRERRELRIAKAEAALTKLSAAKRTKPDAHSSRSKPTNTSPTASTKPAFSSGNANTTASKPRPPTTVGISFTPTSPSTGLMPPKSKDTTKTFSKSKKPFANSRATSKFAPSSIASPNASSTMCASASWPTGSAPASPASGACVAKPAKSPASCANSKRSASALSTSKTKDSKSSNKGIVQK